MKHYCHEIQGDYGPNPYVANIPQQATANVHFRTALWTGCYVQMTLMSIPVCQDVGLEIHKDTDQIIRIEQGVALVKIGKISVRDFHLGHLYFYISEKQPSNTGLNIPYPISFGCMPSAL